VLHQKRIHLPLQAISQGPEEPGLALLTLEFKYAVT
jgi:hypothetical protein